MIFTKRRADTSAYQTKTRRFHRNIAHQYGFSFMGGMACAFDIFGQLPMCKRQDLSSNKGIWQALGKDWEAIGTDMSFVIFSCEPHPSRKSVKREGDDGTGH